MANALKITPVSDKNGQPCLSAQDAQALAEMLARDPAQPFLFASSCSYRTELMVGRLLEAGVPLEAVARIYQAVPKDLEAKGILMTAENNREDRGSFQRLLGLPPDTAAGEFQISTDLKVKFTGGNSVLVQNDDGTKGWDKQWGKGFGMSTDDAPWRGGNHITAGIYVLNPATNEACLTVIDPHLDKENPIMTPVEWKKRVHCDASVVMSGKIGELAKILPECLTPQQREKMDAAVMREAHGSRHVGLDALDHQKYNNIVREMFSLENPDRIDGFRNLGGINAAKFSPITTADWNALTKEERPVLLKAWVEELKPLRDLQDIWQKKFSPQPEQKPQRSLQLKH